MGHNNLDPKFSFRMWGGEGVLYACARMPTRSLRTVSAREYEAPVLVAVGGFSLLVGLQETW